MLLEDALLVNSEEASYLMRARICFSGAGGSSFKLPRCHRPTTAGKKPQPPADLVVKQQHILCLQFNSIWPVTLAHSQIPKILTRRLVPPFLQNRLLNIPFDGCLMGADVCGEPSARSDWLLIATVT